jgi:hypothetical protein
MSGVNEVASSYHSVPESLSDILAGARIEGADGEDEVNRAEEAFPGLNLSDPDSSNDYSSNDSFLDISETSSLNSEDWTAASPEQTGNKKTHCIWSCQKLGQLDICSIRITSTGEICSTRYTLIEHFFCIHSNLIKLLVALYGFRKVLLLSEET